MHADLTKIHHHGPGTAGDLGIQQLVVQLVRTIGGALEGNAARAFAPSTLVGGSRPHQPSRRGSIDRLVESLTHRTLGNRIANVLGYEGLLPIGTLRRKNGWRWIKTPLETLSIIQEGAGGRIVIPLNLIRPASDLAVERPWGAAPDGWRTLIASILGSISRRFVSGA